MLELAGDIFFGLIVLVIGNMIANVAYRALITSDKFLASIARITILGLFFAIALNTMGIADQIVNLAFGLTLGAIAVAVALSFGLGGREAAGKQMEYILDKFRNSNPPSADPKVIVPPTPKPTPPPTPKRPNAPEY